MKTMLLGCAVALVCGIVRAVTLEGLFEEPVFGRAEIPDNHESVKFVVRPMNAWGKAGEAIESLPDTYWSKGPLYPF